MKHKILRLPSVIDKTGLKRSTLYLRIKEGTFPEPVHLGPRAVGWLESDVDTWLAQCIERSQKSTNGQGERHE